MGRLAITKRYSLASVGDGWQDCYLTYAPASYGDLMQLRTLDTDNMTEDDAVNYQGEFVSKRIIGGQVLELNDDNQPVTVPYTPEHLTQLPKNIFDDIFNAISGVHKDPKGLEPTTA